MTRRYTFDKLKEPSPSIGSSRYWVWYTRLCGRGYFKEAIQDSPEDLPKDPWDLDD